MAELLHIYMNNPTAGSTDGTKVSSGTELAPISVLLDAGKGEQKAVKCAVRCESGFHIDGVLTIKFVLAPFAIGLRYRCATPSMVDVSSIHCPVSPPPTKVIGSPGFKAISVK